MSCDITLRDPVTDEVIQFDSPHTLKGGNYALCGTTETWLNITYNYAKHFYRVIGEKGIRTIYGMTGAESMPMLKEAISKLNDCVCKKGATK